MCGRHINLLTQIVLKSALWLAYRNHQIPMSYILGNLGGKFKYVMHCRDSVDYISVHLSLYLGLKK